MALRGPKVELPIELSYGYFASCGSLLAARADSPA